MNNWRCSSCGKALGEHPGVGIIRNILRQKRKQPPRQDSLDVLHDSLEESGHEGLRRYLNYARTHAPHAHYSREAARDIREGLKRPGSVAGLLWVYRHRAYTGHGMYITSPSITTEEMRRGPRRLSYWPSHARQSHVVGFGDLAGVMEQAQAHHARMIRRFHEDRPYPAEGE